MKDFFQKYVTTEAIFSISGALWFVVGAFLPALPTSMPLGIPIPGFQEITITPGLLIGVSLVPILLKMFIPGKTPFVGTGASVTVTNVPVDVKENKDA